MSYTPLHVASYRGDIQEVRRIIQDGFSVDFREETGRTPLHVAVEGGQLDMISELIKLGANIEATDMKGSTPLDKAVSVGEVEIVRELIKLGASMDVHREGLSLIYHASSNGHVEVVKELLENGAVSRFVDEKWSTEVKNVLRNPGTPIQSKESKEVKDLKRRIETLESEKKQCSEMLNTCEVDRSLMKGNLGRLEKELSDAFVRIYTGQRNSKIDDNQIKVLNLVRKDLEESILLLNSAVDNRALANGQLVSEIAKLKEQIKTLSKFAAVERYPLV